MFLRVLSLFIIVSVSSLISTTFAQSNSSTLTVFLDCRSCNESFIRSEIDFVNFVRDQSVAEVQLLVTSQRTGGGGRQFILEFLGLAEYADIDNKLIFISPQADTDELRRNRLVKYVKLGLINYLAEKDVIDQLEVNFIGESNPNENIGEISDPWNGWNFELGARADISGEETRENYRFNGNFRAQRTSENWKVRFNYWQNYRKFVDIKEDSAGNKTRDDFINEEQNVFGLVARSLSDHWTVGGYARGEISTENNYDLRIGATPSIEYSLFPYSEFNRRQVTFRYGILAQQSFYTDTTVFNEIEEFRFRQELTIETEFTQPWGEIDGRMEIGNYLHDFELRRINFNLGMSMRLSRLFSFNVSGRYSVINDQINISGKGLTEAERLLNFRAQQTSYNFGVSVGFEINFGSVYNNVVNPRL